MAVGDEFGRHFKKHPDTGIQFEGFTVPHWADLCELTRIIANEFLECLVIGFDFALTEKGWVLIEINTHPLLIFQIATQIGLKKDVEDYQKKIGYPQNFKKR